MYKTPNGAIVYPTNADGSFRQQIGESGKPTGYLLCQMHPIIPQRFEWVREDRVIKREDKS